MKGKRYKKSLIISVASVLFLLIAIYTVLKIYTKSNYDIKVITNSGRSFFIVDSSFENYYLVNSNLRTKIKTKEFEESINSLSKNDINNIKELKQKDQLFSPSNDKDSVFVFRNNIYYQRTQNYIGDQMINESLKTIYKFDTETKETNLFIKGYDNAAEIELKTAVLQQFYPNLESAISRKCIKGFSCEESYYFDGRILFVTSHSTSAEGTTSYLYEYFPKSNKTKRIAKFKSDVIDVYFQE